MTDIWRTVYECDGNGQYHATGEKRDGALPTLIARRIQELESAEPKIITLKL